LLNNLVAKKSVIGQESSKLENVPLNSNTLTNLIKGRFKHQESRKKFNDYLSSSKSKETSKSKSKGASIEYQNIFENNKNGIKPYYLSKKLP
jgi:hypothetical protein